MISAFGVDHANISKSRLPSGVYKPISEMSRFQRLQLKAAIKHSAKLKNSRQAKEDLIGMRIKSAYRQANYRSGGAHADVSGMNTKALKANPNYTHFKGNVFVRTSDANKIDRDVLYAAAQSKPRRPIVVTSHESKLVLGQAVPSGGKKSPVVVSVTPEAGVMTMAHEMKHAAAKRSAGSTLRRYATRPNKMMAREEGRADSAALGYSSYPKFMGVEGRSASKEYLKRALHGQENTWAARRVKSENRKGRAIGIGVNTLMLAPPVGAASALGATSLKNRMDKK